jgi:hypothetical protein
MFRQSFTIALVGLALGAASCRSSLTDSRRMEWEGGAGIRQRLKSYHVIESAKLGKVGYLKVKEVEEFKGPTYDWSYVYDRNWNELGFIDQLGGATAYHYYSPSEQAAQNTVLRATKLPSDSIQRNVMRILGLDLTTDDVTFPPATQADITGDTGAAHLAGPGVVPANAPTK